MAREDRHEQNLRLAVSRIIDGLRNNYAEIARRFLICLLLFGRDRLPESTLGRARDVQELFRAAQHTQDAADNMEYLCVPDRTENRNLITFTRPIRINGHCDTEFADRSILPLARRIIARARVEDS